MMGEHNSSVVTTLCSLPRIVNWNHHIQLHIMCKGRPSKLFCDTSTSKAHTSFATKHQVNKSIKLPPGVCLDQNDNMVRM